MCREFHITGRVQGVFYRASTRDFAVPLGIRGHAVNLDDGSVEVRACGDDAAIGSLREWLQHGPPRAAVTEVTERAVDCTRPDRFRTG